MYLNAGASQRAQGRSPGSGGRGTHRRGVLSLQAPWPACASRPQEAGGWPHSPHRNTYMEIRWEPRLDYTYYLACPRAEMEPRSARVAASSAHSGLTSDCGGTSVGIVNVSMRSSSALPHARVQARPAASGNGYFTSRVLNHEC